MIWVAAEGTPERPDSIPLVSLPIFASNYPLTLLSGIVRSEDIPPQVFAVRNMARKVHARVFQWANENKEARYGEGLALVVGAMGPVRPSCSVAVSSKVALPRPIDPV
jgi:hypothetical protein